MELPSDGPPTFFLVAFALVALVVLGGMVLVVVVALRNRKVLKDAGLDPLTAEAQLAVRFAHSGLLSPAASPATLEQRLAELADLHARGVISDEELAAARAKALQQ